MQSGEETDSTKEQKVRLIGDITDVAYSGTDVMGVGLVVGLNGTGGGTPPASAYRDMLENELKRRQIDDIKGVLSSPNCAMVLLSAVLPPGGKGEPVDVEVSLPDQSHCTSLRGGYLTMCHLINYDSTDNLKVGFKGQNQSLRGSILVKAEGPVVIGESPHSGMAEGEDESQKRGRIWGGGICLVSSPIMLIMREQNPHISALVAERINQLYAAHRQGRDAVAVAKTNRQVILDVPMQYRLNIEHFLRIVRAIPLQGTPPIDSQYCKEITDQLLDPARCLSAAIRLEALGEESVPTLKAALTAPSPLTRFAAAHALAYLRKPVCAEELSRLTREQPVFRMLGLTAMASLDEYACRSRLNEMMADKEPEVRYGAFRALTTLDERAPEVAGVRLNEAFWLHQVAHDSQPMIHLLTSRRPEVVLFGEPQMLVPPFAFSVGEEFTIVAKKDEAVCTIKRFSLKHGQPVRQCTLNVADVLKNLADIGGGWTDATDLLKKADANGRLSCELRSLRCPSR